MNKPDPKPAPICAKPNPREGWAEQYARALRDGGPEELMFPDYFPSEFDETEWTW